MELIRRALTPYVLLRNQLDYPLRRLIRPRFAVRRVEPAGLAAALAGLPDPDAARARALIERYQLGELVARGRRRDVLENLYYLELLATALDRADAALPDPLAALDAGCSDWFYAPALVAALRHWRAARPRVVDVQGFEADPGRRYADGHSREDWAAWYTDRLPEARYVPRDVRSFQGRVDLATMLFPFVFSRDGDDWGLPRRVFRPGEVLAHVWSSLRPGGLLIVANQGEAEASQQRRLFAGLGVEIAWSGRVESRFWRYEIERWVHVARRGRKAGRAGAGGRHVQRRGPGP